MSDDRWEHVAGEDDWDQALAAKLDGATVLVGLTHRARDGEELREQFFGTVMAVDPGEGVTLRLDGERAGEIVTLPPLLEAFEVAEAGIYRLQSTGEEVVDPDYTASWTVTQPAN